MTKCPDCGAAVGAPYKTWSVTRKASGRGSETTISLGMFECPECGNRFRAGVKGEMKRELSLRGVSEKIRGIEGELVSTLKNLREKLKTLETERANLLLEIDELKKMAEARASALESEISMLHEEVKSLKQLLGVGDLAT